VSPHKSIAWYSLCRILWLLLRSKSVLLLTKLHFCNRARFGQGGRVGFPFLGAHFWIRSLCLFFVNFRAGEQFKRLIRALITHIFRFYRNFW
jgi:hypothetical protein